MLVQKSIKRKNLSACTIFFNLPILFFGTYVILLTEPTPAMGASL